MRLYISIPLTLHHPSSARQRRRAARAFSRAGRVDDGPARAWPYRPMAYSIGMSIVPIGPWTGLAVGWAVWSAVVVPAGLTSRWVSAERGAGGRWLMPVLA
jgi:hypothetical protein